MRISYKLLTLVLIVAHSVSASITFEINKDGTEYMVSRIDRSSSGSINIPNEHNGLPVTSIGGYAFSGNDNITSVVIPQSLTHIGPGAFRDCSQLVYIIFEGEAPSLVNSEDSRDDIVNSSTYALVQNNYIESFGGEGTNFSGLILVNINTIKVAADLTSESEIDINRAGSLVIEVEDSEVEIPLIIEETSDIKDWTIAEEKQMTLQIDTSGSTRFYRFKVTE